MPKNVLLQNSNKFLGLINLHLCCVCIFLLKSNQELKHMAIILFLRFGDELMIIKFLELWCLQFCFLILVTPFCGLRHKSTRTPWDLKEQRHDILNCFFLCVCVSLKIVVYWKETFKY